MTKDSARIQTKAALLAAQKLGLIAPGDAQRLGETVAVLDDGRRLLRRSPTSELPTAMGALANLEATVLAERRHDVTVPLSALQMCAKTGRIGRGEGGRPISYAALVQLGRLLPHSPAQAGKYWATIEPRRRAREFHETIADHKFWPARIYNKKLVLRLLTPKDGKEYIYATVGTGYQQFNPDAACRFLRSAIEGTDLQTNAKGSYSYHGTEWTIRLHLENAVGLGHAILRVHSTDDTRTAIYVYVDMALPSGARIGSTEPYARIHHRGNNMTVRLRNALDSSVHHLEPLADLWQDRRGIEVRSMKTAIEVLCGVPQSQTDKRRGWSKLRSRHVKPEDMARLIHDAWTYLQTRGEEDQRPGSSQAGLAWAIAEAAQHHAWPTEKHIDSLEQAASALLAMGPRSFLRACGELKDRDQQVAVANQELADEVLALANESRETFQAAEKARAEGDNELADELQERAELLAIKQDQVAEGRGR
jgi:hypothetical protein